MSVKLTRIKAYRLLIQVHAIAFDPTQDERLRFMCQEALRYYGWRNGTVVRGDKPSRPLGLDELAAQVKEACDRDGYVEIDPNLLPPEVRRGLEETPDA